MSAQKLPLALISINNILTWNWNNSDCCNIGKEQREWSDSL